MQSDSHGAGVIDRPNCIPLSYLIHTKDVLLEHGQDISALLTEFNILTKNLSDTSFELSGQQYYALMEDLLQNSDIPALGVKVGRKFSIGDYGVLGYAFISSQTLIQAMKIFFRYQAIVGSEAMFEEMLRIEGDKGIISVNCHTHSEIIKRFEIEESFGQWLATAASVTMNGVSLQFSRVNFTFSEPASSQIYKDLFNCPVYFDRPANELHFPKSMMDQRFSMANEITAQLCEQQCETILNNLQKLGGLVAEVRRLIINQPGQAPDPEEVASQLNVSYRTLRRRLSDENTSFREIHNDVRMGMAAEYLRQTELSTQEIAFLLGYSEVTTFHRAFKKHQGVTPRECRDLERVK